MSRSWKKSRALLERAQKSLAGGVSSPFRAKSPVPLYFVNGEGARLEDVDGNQYIDYALAWGPMILGYRHPKQLEAMRLQVERPLSFGAQHELEIAVAEKIQQLVPCAERVAFTSSGSEAVQLAQRLCRAYTRRNLILKFEGHYHGWMDSTLISYHAEAGELGPPDSPKPILGSRGQVANAADNVIVAPWNRLDILEQIISRNVGRIAAVMMEPILCNSGCLLPLPGYLQGVQDLCRRYGVLLVFDEIITGFRVGLGGAQGVYGVTPDLGTFGKAMGGGAPISMVAGKKEILNLMFGGGVVFGGTFNGNPLSLAATLATLTELSRDNGTSLAHANRVGKSLIDEIPTLAQKHGIPLTLCGVGAAFALHFTSKTELLEYRDTLEDDVKLLERFLSEALREGIHMLPDGRVYVSTVHMGKEIDETIGALERVFANLRA